LLLVVFIVGICLRSADFWIPDECKKYFIFNFVQFFSFEAEPIRQIMNLCFEAEPIRQIMNLCQHNISLNILWIPDGSHVSYRWTFLDVGQQYYFHPVKIWIYWVNLPCKRHWRLYYHKARIGLQTRFRSNILN